MYEKEIGHFDINDVTNDVCAKLVHRHPHIFGEVDAKTSDEVLSNWEAIKNVEKNRETLYDKLNSVPKMTPALIRGGKVAKKSGEYKSKTNLDIIDEMRRDLENMSKTPDAILESDMGELLFKICALSFKNEIDAEEALFRKTNSFIDNYKE